MTCSPASRTRQAAAFVMILTLSSGLVSAQQGNRSDASPGTLGEYHRVLEEWKSLVKEMRTLQLDFVESNASGREKITKRWDELVTSGGNLLDRLQVAGLAAYAEAPGEDRDLERFLVDILVDHLEHDRYDNAASLSKAMLDHGCKVKQVYDLAGVAAFVLNEFDAAERYLSQAEQMGALVRGKELKPLIDDYREFWKAETELRAKEAEANDLPRVRLTTTKGEIVVELFENEAPNTVGNFVSLVESEFYDGLSFHRVLAGYMAQGGCPLGTGVGNPGYNIYCECYQPNHRKHFRGSLSMAKGPTRDTGGSQFFLTFVPTWELNGDYTVFGRIIEGMEVLEKITRIDPSAPDKPEPDRIVKAEVLRKRDHEYKPDRVR